jgi:hypothetical protein
LAGGISGALAGFGAFSSIANSFGGNDKNLADMSQADADALQADYENQAIASRPSTPQIQQLSASRFSPQLKAPSIFDQYNRNRGLNYVK